MKLHSLYVLRDPQTNVIRYVGQTSRKPSARLSQHFVDARETKKNKKKFRSSNWITHLRRLGLYPVQQVLIASTDAEYINRLEIAVIKGLRNRGWDLTNQSRGGSVNSGWHHTDEYKALNSAKHKGKVLSEETKRRMSESQKANTTRVIWQTGKPRPEHIKESCREKWRDPEKRKAYDEKMFARGNKSGYPGVRQSLKRWYTEIVIEGQTVKLGTYDDPAYAHEVYMEAKKTYHYGFGEVKW